VIVELFTEGKAHNNRNILSSINSFLNNPGGRFKRAYDALGTPEKELLLTLLDASTAVEKNKLEKDYERRVSEL